MGKAEFDPVAREIHAWNAGRKVGAKRALKTRQVWATRFFPDQHRRLRDRALFDLAIDSKLRGCDVVKVRIGDLASGGQVRTRAIVVQQKTGRPVQFELKDDARASPLAWLESRGGTSTITPFPAASITPTTSVRGNTRVWSVSGSQASDCGAKSTARTRCVERRRRSSTRRPAIYAPCRSFSVTQRSRALSDTSA